MIQFIVDELTNETNHVGKLTIRFLLGSVATLILMLLFLLVTVPMFGIGLMLVLGFIWGLGWGLSKLIVGF